MPYISNEALQEARRVDLLTWLQCNEPGNLVHIRGNNYCTREHDSLKISNGKWYWFSQGFGGVSALDYLIKVEGHTLPEAAEMILGSAVTYIEPSYTVPHMKAAKELKVPDLLKNPAKAKAYLLKRGIHPEVISYCISHSMLYETCRYHNVIFVGCDKYGIARYGAMRGTMSDFKNEISGSDKRFAFTISDNPEADHLHLFESAIDLMSYASLQIMEGKDWKKDSLQSLAGVYAGGEKLPAALSQFLEDHPDVRVIHLHLDNDEVGRKASESLMEELKDKFIVLDEPPAYGKDMNDTLLNRAGIKVKRKEERER